MSLTTVTKEHIWDYYVKLSNFKAQCKFCKNQYNYILSLHFQVHIAIHHKEVWKYKKEKKLTKPPWKYFKYLDNVYSKCIICDASILSRTESVEDHLRLHSLQQLENTIHETWSWKYCTQKDDFAVKCDICHKNLSLSVLYSNLISHIKKVHPNEVKNMQETYDIADSSKCVSLPQSDTMSDDNESLNIVTKKHVWKFYIKLSDFTAQCMFCENKYNYLIIIDFHRHIVKHHKEIWKYEEERKLTKWLWMYFKYLNQLYSQCIICDANVQSAIDSVENHLSSHSEEQRKIYKYRNWSSKYYTKRDDFVVECDICHKNVALSIPSYLNFHITRTHLDKVKNMLETHDIAGSSKHVSSFQTDTISKLMLKNCYVLLKKSPHYNLYM